MGLTGLEPVTLRLSSACSNQLSYRPAFCADDPPSPGSDQTPTRQESDQRFVNGQALMRSNSTDAHLVEDSPWRAPTKLKI